MVREDKVELAPQAGATDADQRGQPQLAVQALLAAGQTLNALTVLASGMVREAALMLDTTILFDLCAARLTKVLARHTNNTPDVVALRNLVKEGIKELLVDEHLRLHSLQSNSDWDDFTGGQELQLPNFGAPPGETRRNAVHFNALPLKTRRAFFVGAGTPLAGDADEEQTSQTITTETRTLCIRAVEVLLGRRDEHDE